MYKHYRFSIVLLLGYVMGDKIHEKTCILNENTENFELNKTFLLQVW